MSKHFKVGEIVIVKRANRHPEHVGSEVEIVGPLQPYVSAVTGQTEWGYEIKAPNGKHYGARPEDLHKRPPKYRRPRSGSWSACPFKPAGVRS